MLIVLGTLGTPATPRCTPPPPCAGELRLKRLKRGDDPRGPAWRREKVEAVDPDESTRKRYGAVHGEQILGLEAALNARFAMVSESMGPSLWPALALRC